MEVTFGTDPEFFAADKGGILIRAYKYPVGTKGEPTPVTGMAHWGVLADGAAFEFNTSMVYTDLDTMRKDLLKAMKIVEKELEITFLPWVHANCPLSWEKDQEFMTIGCDPDMDAVSGQLRPPMDAKNLHHGGMPFRSAGGHLHIGVKGDWPQIPKRAFVRLLDQIWRSCWAEHPKSGGDFRNQFYRRHGLYREKPYGVEYRSPSSAWLLSAPSFPRVRLESSIRRLLTIAENPSLPEYDELVAIYVAQAEADAGGYDPFMWLPLAALVDRLLNVLHPAVLPDARPEQDAPLPEGLLGRVDQALLAEMAEELGRRRLPGLAEMAEEFDRVAGRRE